MIIGAIFMLDWTVKKQQKILNFGENLTVAFVAFERGSE